jgi:hypothetical protein
MKTKHRLARAGALASGQFHAAALVDADAWALAPERLAGTKQMPRLNIIRGPVPDPARHAARLGTGRQGTGSGHPIMSPR